MLECGGCEGRSAPLLHCWYVWIGSLIHWSYRTHVPFDSKVATLRVKQKRKARTGINPSTKQKIKNPAKTVLKFRVAKDTILGVKK